MSCGWVLSSGEGLVGSSPYLHNMGLAPGSVEGRTSKPIIAEPTDEKFPPILSLIYKARDKSSVTTERRAAIARLLEIYEKPIKRLLKKNYSSYNGWHPLLGSQDLEAEAHLAFIKAIEKWPGNEETGSTPSEFFQYASKVIRNKLADYIFRHRFVIKPPDDMRELARRMRVVKESNSNAQTLVEKLGIPEHQIREFLHFLEQVDSPVPFSREESSDSDVKVISPENVVYRETDDPAFALAKGDGARALAIVKQQLNQREKDVISLYYDENQTFGEIGQLLGVSGERVRQIHNTAIAKLKLPLSPMLNHEIETASPPIIARKAPKKKNQEASSPADSVGVQIKQRLALSSDMIERISPQWVNRSEEARMAVDTLKAQITALDAEDLHLLQGLREVAEGEITRSNLAVSLGINPQALYRAEVNLYEKLFNSSEIDIELFLYAYHRINSPLWVSKMILGRLVH
jgi:RNA polymerase sigma factor for flagellar operon FliA